MGAASAAALFRRSERWKLRAAPDSKEPASTPFGLGHSACDCKYTKASARAEFGAASSDRVNAAELSRAQVKAPAKIPQVNLSPPADDAKVHPKSSAAVADAEAEALTPGGVSELHTWDPHKAAKSVEVGDFYFKRKNYRAAEDRYREALRYKDNDAVATMRLAICLEKLGIFDGARAEYESYLKICRMARKPRRLKKPSTGSRRMRRVQANRDRLRIRKRCSIQIRVSSIAWNPSRRSPCFAQLRPESGPAATLGRSMPCPWRGRTE